MTITALKSPDAAARWLRAWVTGTITTNSRKVRAGDGFIAWPGIGTVLHAWTPVGALLIAALMGSWAFRKLPVALNGVSRRRPILTIAWSILALVTVVQTARLSLYVEDPERGW